MKKKLLACLIGCSLALQSQNWTDVNSPISNDLNDVFFLDDQNGWIVGRQGKIIRTTDGGQTWTEQNSGTTKDLTKIFMVDASTGYAVGDGGVFIRYNGTTWSVKNINFSQDMCGVFFLDADEGWISGDWGRIMHTTDGGESWTNQVTNAMYSNKFNDLYFLSSNEGWAVGTSGRVLKYNGSNWQNVSNPAASDLKDLYAVSFSSPGNGFMTGKNSLVYFNDGSSLSQHNTELPDNSFHVYDVVVVNDQDAYAATTPGLGGQGIILRYNGVSWKKDYEYTGMGTELFYGIAVTPSGNVFAVGPGGLIKMKKMPSQPTGISETSADPAVSLFPVPVNDNVNLQCQLKQSGVVEVMVTDPSGRVVLEMSQHAEAGACEIVLPTSGLEAGCYFYKLHGPGLGSTGKFLKN